MVVMNPISRSSSPVQQSDFQKIQSLAKKDLAAGREVNKRTFDSDRSLSITKAVADSFFLKAVRDFFTPQDKSNFTQVSKSSYAISHEINSVNNSLSTMRLSKSDGTFIHTSVKTLEIDTLESFEEKIKCFPNLHSIKLSAKEIPNWEFLRNYPDLTQLDLSECRQIEDFSFLQYCPKLNSLNLSKCTQIHGQELCVLQYCPELNFLSLFACTKLQDVSFLQHCSMLKELNARFCDQIQSFLFVKHCPGLVLIHL